jgi:predicted RNA-binding Zn ribbon-like protein
MVTARTARAALDRPAARMKRVAGQLCLDFTNSVGGWDPAGDSRFEVRDERLPEYADLVAWSVGAGSLPEADAAPLVGEAARRPAQAEAVLARARRLRQALYHTGWHLAHGRAPDREDLAVVEREIRLARQQQRLAGTAAGLSWTLARDPAALDLPLWPIALSAEAYLTGGDVGRLRACPGDECGWLFEDASRNRSRQWCDMRDCGNVAKVRRYRSRQRT